MLLPRLAHFLLLRAAAFVERAIARFEFAPDARDVFVRLRDECFLGGELFFRARTQASALPRRACTISAFSRGSRARSAPIRSICACKSAGGGSVACKVESFFSSSRSAASFSCRRRSTVASSFSQRSAVDFASSRRSTKGRFSSSSLASAAVCSREFSCRCASICLSASSIFAIRTATSFCSCSSFFSATISLRTSGKFRRLRGAFAAESDLGFLQDAFLVLERHARALPAHFQRQLAQSGGDETHRVA